MTKQTRKIITTIAVGGEILLCIFIIMLILEIDSFLAYILAGGLFMVFISIFDYTWKKLNKLN